MKCKPEDLAIVIKGAQSGGRIVRCIRLLSAGEKVRAECGQLLNIKPPAKELWLIEGYVLLKADNGKHYWAPCVGDHCLRPIGNPGEGERDETLQWLDVPQDEHLLTSVDRVAA